MDIKERLGLIYKPYQRLSDHMYWCQVCRTNWKQGRELGVVLIGEDVKVCTGFLMSNHLVFTCTWCKEKIGAGHFLYSMTHNQGTSFAYVENFHGICAKKAKKLSKEDFNQIEEKGQKVLLNLLKDVKKLNPPKGMWTTAIKTNPDTKLFYSIITPNENVAKELILLREVLHVYR